MGMTASASTPPTMRMGPSSRRGSTWSASRPPSQVPMAMPDSTTPMTPVVTSSVTPRCGASSRTARISSTSTAADAPKTMTAASHGRISRSSPLPFPPRVLRPSHACALRFVPGCQGSTPISMAGAANHNTGSASIDDTTTVQRRSVRAPQITSTTAAGSLIHRGIPKWLLSGWRPRLSSDRRRPSRTTTVGRTRMRPR